MWGFSGGAAICPTPLEANSLSIMPGGGFSTGGIGRGPGGLGSTMGTGGGPIGGRGVNTGGRTMGTYVGAEYLGAPAEPETRTGQGRVSTQLYT